MFKIEFQRDASGIEHIGLFDVIVWLKSIIKSKKKELYGRQTMLHHTGTHITHVRVNGNLICNSHYYIIFVLQYFCTNRIVLNLLCIIDLLRNINTKMFIECLYTQIVYKIKYWEDQLMFTSTFKKKI